MADSHHIKILKNTTSVQIWLKYAKENTDKILPMLSKSTKFKLLF